ncbi:hypothetical protein TPENAI_30048 [Tenacibaculum litopenaei]|uniref:RHS repeat domain-containing protein n=1 Tax=Tenacibaculum litopenaei TaxID=396016 RepID=UPI003894CED2
MYNNVTNSLGNSVAQKFEANGKELNEEPGIQWHDFGARNYDAALGRWMNLDPLAEKYYEYTPYNYVGSNPIIRTDPTGMDWYTDKDGNYHFNPELNEENSKEILKKGQKYVGQEKFLFRSTYKGQGVGGQSYMLNSDGSVTDYNKDDNGAIDSGSSVEIWGKTITAYDDKPSENLTKNGDTFKSIDGNTYKFQNNEWVKLSGNLMDASFLRVGSTGLVSAGNNTIIMDQAQITQMMKSNLSNLTDIQGFTSGMVIGTVVSKKPPLPNGIAVSLTILYNQCKGLFDQLEQNKTHDVKVDKARKQIKKK